MLEVSYLISSSGGFPCTSRHTDPVEVASSKGLRSKQVFFDLADFVRQTGRAESVNGLGSSSDLPFSFFLCGFEGANAVVTKGAQVMGAGADAPCNGSQPIGADAGVGRGMGAHVTGA